MFNNAPVPVVEAVSQYLDAVLDGLDPSTCLNLSTPVAEYYGVPSDVTAAEFRVPCAKAYGALRNQRGLPAKHEECVYAWHIDAFPVVDPALGAVINVLTAIPWLRHAFGITNLIVLPLFPRGEARRKGVTGSPFAVRDFDCLAPSSHPCCNSADSAWTVLTALARSIGVRLGMNIPVATIAIDSKLVAAVPDLVHWWRANPSRVVTGHAIRPETPSGDRAATPYDSAEFETAPTPTSDKIRFEATPEGMLAVARDPDGRLSSVVNAFPDPVVDISETCAWKDVAGLRVFEDNWPPVFGRSIEDRCDLPVSSAYRIHISSIVKRRRKAGDRCCIVDVSSVLPVRHRRRPSLRHPELFIVAEQLNDFTDPNAFEFVQGPLVSRVAPKAYVPENCAKELLQQLRRLTELCRDNCDTRFFAGVSNHDGAPVDFGFGMALTLVFNALPNTIPFIYSGSEWGETRISNIGFGSSPPGTDISEKALLLFSPVPISPNAEKLAHFRKFWRNLQCMRTLIFGEDWTRKRKDFFVERTGLLVHGGWDKVRFVINCGHEPEDLEPLLSGRGMRFYAGFVNDQGNRNLCAARCAIVEVA